jgi:hypothetical protein
MLMPRSGPVTYPAELAHEYADAFHDPTSQWPSAESAPPPPVPQALSMPPGPPGSGPRPRRRRGRGRGWLVAALALILAGGGAGAALALTGGNGTPQAGGAKTPAAGASVNSSSSMASPTPSAGMSSMNATAVPATESARTANCAPGGKVALAAGNMGKIGPTTLTGVLQQANLCSSPENDLPPSSCKAQSAANVTCNSPVPGVAQVVFHTYTSRTDLYSAYESQVTLLNGSYQQNTMTHCGNTIPGYSETGWNHLEAHPTEYTLQEMESASFSQVDAMGRQACFSSNGKPYFVWTTDVGNMLAVAQGSGSMSALYNWWAQIHHVIIFPGTEMCGQAMGRMGSVPQGNLISAPVCPSGVTPNTTSTSMSSGM